MTTKQKPNPFLAVKQAHQAGIKSAEEDVVETRVHKVESAPVHKSTSAQSNVVRKPSGQRLRTDLVKKYKLLSAESGKPIYMLMEEALEEYLSKQSKQSALI